MSLFGNTLLFSGCMYRYFLKEKFEKYRTVLGKFIDFIVIPNEPCCGLPLKNLGYEKEFREHVENVFEIFRKYSVKRVICPCPACYHTLKKEYPKYLGKKWKIEVKTAVEILYELTKKGKLEIKNKEVTLTYHDPCHLGRYSGIYDEPREILKKFGNLREMEFSRELSMCCGAGGGVKTNFPEIARKIGERRIEQALKTEAKYLVTACPMCYYHLKECSNGKIEVLDIIDIFQ